MSTVYALSPKGRRECATEPPTLPAELRDLLRMVDGRRTCTDLLSAVGKNAVTAGGLRWLTASGYIHPAADSRLDELDGQSGALAVGASRRSPDFAVPAGSRSEAEVCHALSDFMVRAIGRHLGEGGYLYLREIRGAVSVGELLPHLNALIEGILIRAGSEAAAEFADTAAYILHPLESGES